MLLCLKLGIEKNKDKRIRDVFELPGLQSDEIGYNSGSQC